MIATVFLLAAGLGTRMRPWTLAAPKPLLCVGKTPLIVHHLDRLAEEGVDHVLINCHHLRHRLRGFLDLYFERRLRPRGIRLTVLEEETLLGTGGGLGAALARVETERLLVINTDVVHRFDFGKLSAAHERNGGLATFAVTPSPSESLRQVAVETDGRISRFGPVRLRPDAAPARFAFTGIHAVERRVLDYATPVRPGCILRDVYQKAADGGESLFAFETTAYWRDVGDFDAYREVHRDLIEGRHGWHNGRLLPPEKEKYI